MNSSYQQFTYRDNLKWFAGKVGILSGALTSVLLFLHMNLLGGAVFVENIGQIQSRYSLLFSLGYSDAGSIPFSAAGRWFRYLVKLIALYRLAGYSQVTLPYVTRYMSVYLWRLLVNHIICHRDLDAPGQVN